MRGDAGPPNSDAIILDNSNINIGRITHIVRPAWACVSADLLLTGPRREADREEPAQPDRLHAASCKGPLQKPLAKASYESPLWEPPVGASCATGVRTSSQIGTRA